MGNIQMENNFSTSSFLGGEEDESMRTTRTNKSNKRPKRQGNGKDYESNRVHDEDASDGEQEKVLQQQSGFKGFANNLANHMIGENTEEDL